VIEERLTARGVHSRYERAEGSSHVECAYFIEAGKFLRNKGHRVLDVDATGADAEDVALRVVAAVTRLLKDQKTDDPERVHVQPQQPVPGARGAGAGYRDAFRLVAPGTLDYSWVGRTGDGYRYDHAHVSGPLAGRVQGCRYVHEPRTDEDRLTDHSALTVALDLEPVARLTVST
jgi:hypothetical protein